MRKHILIAGVLGVAGLRGQVLSNNELFQKLNIYSDGVAGSAVVDEGFGGRLIKGKPFSATEERHFLQVLGDGTRIETTETNRLFRDADGRTRIEQMNGVVNIYDPMTRTRVRLDPATKTAHKGNGGPFSFVIDEAIDNAMDSVFRNLNVGTASRSNPSNMKGVMSETTENLGSQSVNGVTAQGVRTTMTIPKGQIGNNKDIKVLTERWTSTDLQMLVKSVNSDPRFGDTTYQLTKVVRSAPDAALFQVPSDYTVTDTKTNGRGAAAAERAVQKARGAQSPSAPPAPPVAPLPPQ
jgi:hypothetical protein